MCVILGRKLDEIIDHNLCRAGVKTSEIAVILDKSLFTLATVQT
jgi:hypothetical protein